VTDHDSVGSVVLVVTAGALDCAIPLHDVAETMRPLPIEPVPGTPYFVRGVALIRGEPTPVVDLKALLENGENSKTYGRFVSLKLGDRRVAIGVDSVVGLRNVNSARLRDLPPILRNVAADLIEAIGASDDKLLLVLRAARIIPTEVWTTLAAAEATP
jgi:purine-binding chemotaxis protein CheW